MEGYQRGLALNPDILCNQHIKFGTLYDYAVKEKKADWLATGHYAQLQYSRTGELHFYITVWPWSTDTV